MAIWRALRRLRITRKKKTVHAQQQDRLDVQAQRQAFNAKLAVLDPERLVFVDETGATTAMTRIYGRDPAGERVGGAVPGQWEAVTLVTALRMGGVGPALAFAGATDTIAFPSYVEEMLVPQLRPGDVVIWDNRKPLGRADCIRPGSRRFRSDEPDLRERCAG